MINWKPGLASQLILVSLIASLSLWASIPFFVGQYGGVSGPLGGTITTLEVLVLTLPVAGIVASLYGWYYKKLILAFLIGALPYVPLIFLGIPAVFFLGVPMGMIGSGSTWFRMGKTVRGSVLAILGAMTWVIITALILGGFR
ncbi:MAG TPA: hypothetical protein VJL56_00690 [Candidatus Bathyarchaeia archaeon]|nr:hypothetical protein [Candidatus Bathyarchaeia archaeon]